MARSLLNGAEQIAAGTLPLTALVTGYSIPTTNLADGANFIIKTGTVAFTANQSMGGFLLQNLGTCVSGTDAANKSYVDSKVNGLQLHFVRLVGTANVSLTGEQTIDGVTTSASRVLLTGQTTTSQNGPWITGSGSWARPADWAAASTLPEGQYVISEDEGTTYKNTKWFCLNTGNTVVDTTATTFAQDSSGSSYTSSNGILLTGTNFAPTYGSTSNTIAQGNDSRIVNALQTTALGTGVQMALGVAAGTGAGFALLSSGLLTAAEFPALTGDVTTTAGSLTTTINNTAGTGFVKYTNEVVGEIVGGTFNGSNTAFTLAYTPSTVKGGASSVALYLNGQRLRGGSGNDYTISGTSITMLFAPVSTDTLTADYAV